MCQFAHANEYFDYSTGRLSDGSRARASDVNAIYDAIETGLDKLPTEAEIKLGTIQYGTEAGAADAYTITMPYTPSGYTDGMGILFKASATNTGASTVNVDSLGVKDIVTQDGTALSAGDITSGDFIFIVYNSTSGDFEIQNFNRYATVESNESAVAALSAGSGVKVSSNDSTLGYLDGKLVAGTAITLTPANDGGDETLTVATSAITSVAADTTPQAGGEFDFQAHSAGFTPQEHTGDGSTTIDWKTGNKANFVFATGTNETFTFTAPSKSGTLTLRVKQDADGGQTATWPAGIYWFGTVLPTLNSAANGVTVCNFLYDGTYYYGHCGSFGVP